MDKINFNHDWMIAAIDQTTPFLVNHQGTFKKINLPHDAMIEKKRNPNCVNGSRSGYFEGDNYLYLKYFSVPSHFSDKRIYIEFEGIYMNSMIYVNNSFIGKWPYGYTGFHFEISKHLKFGEMNEIRVIVLSKMEPNSRWYSGNGIYRNVNLYVGDIIHIPINGIKITTHFESLKKVQIETITTIKTNQDIDDKITMSSEIFDCNHHLIQCSKMDIHVKHNMPPIHQMFCMDNPSLWSPTSPNLYIFRQTILKNNEKIDQFESKFGIRKLEIDSKNGLKINEEPIKLRGACIHHDHGLLGSCAYEDAEERKIKALKSAGFNAIRSAHNPISKYALDVCDKEGILVIDEAFDVWNHSKSEFDYSLWFNEWWEKDIEAMIDKDFNHPSVIMYSIGNEIKEIGLESSIEIGKKIRDKVRFLDSTRWITNAINGMFSVMDKMEEIMGFIMQKNAEKNQMRLEKPVGKPSPDELMSMIISNQNEIVKYPLVDERLNPHFDYCDIAGYNYMTARYVDDSIKYSNRIILGTETLSPEIGKIWPMIEKSTNIIGDFCWTGWDYLGETGVGQFCYDGVIPTFNMTYPCLTANVGDIDITGFRKPISYYREIVFGLRKTPYIAVQRPIYYGKKMMKLPWVDTDCVESWSWNGFEDKKVIVEVYSDADEVELILNDKVIGRKKVGVDQEYKAIFDMIYQPGTLQACNIRNDIKCETFIIKSPSNASIKLNPNKHILKADSNDLCFIDIDIKDLDGNRQTYPEICVKAFITGHAQLIGFGSGDSNNSKHFNDQTMTTYDGRLLAILKAGKTPGKAIFAVESEGFERKEIVIEII